MKFRPKTLVISGNGSVYWQKPGCVTEEKNVWNLVQHTVAEFRQSPEGRGVGVPDDALNILQWVAGTELFIERLTKACPEDDPKYQPAKDLNSNVRHRLGGALSNADIRLRSICCFDCDRADCVGGIKPQKLSQCGFMTLNWDLSVRCLENSIQLHGACDTPESMIFPNQTFTNLLPDGRIFRQGLEVTTYHHWMASCENIIIWGCRLNDYDAIIPTLLSIFTLQDRQGRVNLFVSLPDSKEREIVKKKLKDFMSNAILKSCLSELDL